MLGLAECSSNGGYQAPSLSLCGPAAPIGGPLGEPGRQNEPCPSSVTTPAPTLGNALHPAVRRIVTDALARGIGSTLPTNAYYLREHGIRAGTIQRALQLLQEWDALQISSHGHRGRTISAINVGQAWQAAGLSPVRLLLLPSGAAEIDVLEDALAQGLTDLGIPHTVHHRRGGPRRLDSVAAGEHDIALTSAGVSLDTAGNQSAREAAVAVREAPLTRALPPGTYYASGRLVVVRRTADLAADPRRVAIDSQSPDHVTLPKAEFPETAGMTYVETSFPRVPAAVLRGDVDAGIWHQQRSIIPLDLAGLTTHRLGEAATIDAWQHLSPAVLVGWAGRPELAAVLASLPLAGVEAKQHEALRNDSNRDDEV